MNFLKKSKRGFTLIELLVVVAIIGLLSSVVLASLNSAKAKGRDAKRATDVRQLKTALEMYYNDSGSYPSVACGQGCGVGISSALTAPLGPYLKVIPDDPLSGNGWQYVTGPSNAYGLWIYYEKTAARCLSGVNLNFGWWGPIVACPF